jgi:endo-1,4-beta-xylanase
VKSKSRGQKLKQVVTKPSFIVAVILLVITAVFLRLHKQTISNDVLSGHDWAHFAGAVVTKDGVQINPLNQSIIHQDGSKAQLNPPVNVHGPHLTFSGNFEIKATMEGADDGASLQLYGQVPVIYDEWRQERPSFRLDVSGKRVEGRIWDGNASVPMDIRSYNVDLKDDAVVSLRREKGFIRIAINGNNLGSMPDHNIFSEGKLWFGADGNDKGNGWLLSKLEARALHGENLQIVDLPSVAVRRDDPNLLRNLSDRTPRKLPIGVAVSAYPLFTDDIYRQIVASQFSLVTLESSIKAQFIHPAPNKYNFTDADNIVDAAKANGQAVHGHTLIFAKSNPSWITDTPKEELPKVMTDHITNVVEHFKGRVSSWDVVNEPLSEKDEDYTASGLGLRTSFWETNMGESYIDKAFIAARAADPSAKLYLNDYGIEHAGQRWDAILTLVQRLKARGVPIDGVGFESHVYEVPDKTDFGILQAHIQALAGLGLSVRISEIDVTGKEQQFQNDQYAGVLQTCQNEPNCTSYTTWGVTDLYGSTTVSDRYPLLLGSSLLWDKDMKPKPALTALQETLKKSATQ